MKKAVLSLIVVFICVNLSFSQKPVFSSETDLNSDNKIEKISLKSNTDSDGFTLKISNKEIKGTFESGEEADGFLVIDINKRDKYKEIAVHTPGPSDDDEYLIYWYNGNEIIYMDHLSRWPTFKGNGIVYVNTWEGFWSCRDKYVLDNNARKLKKVEQFAYYVGQKATVKKGFIIYKDQSLKMKVALLSVGSEIEILLCDKSSGDFFNYKYLIKSKSGLLGWAGLREIENNTKGLVMAD